ncbi:MAG TPA: sugar ABC transporter permease [Halanaerobiales bacterium]|nr:sugar ABC transporter permease [Halanaerobiales bacterium]
MKKRKVQWRFLAIPLIFYTIWVIGPTIYTFYLSLTEWDGLTDPSFIGITNYLDLFNDSVFYTSLVNNFIWLFIFLLIPVVLGLFLAILLSKKIRWAKGFKAAIYSPMILAPVVIGLIWSWIYHPKAGILNNTLTYVGLDFLTRGWLSDPETALYAVIGAAVWRHTGYVMLLFLAGLTSIPPTLIEAARIDGATAWQRFRYIILPLLKPATVIVLVITMIQSLRAFDFVNIMTRGGPFNSTNVLANYMYTEAFRNYEMGYGAAIAVILFIIMFVFIFFYLRRIREEELNV